MIDYQEFCDRFWIAANRETMRMSGRSESRYSGSSATVDSDSDSDSDEGSLEQQQINSDRLSFARFAR